MIISIIVAKGLNNEIGKNNNLLWHLPDEMKYFTNTTNNHTIITGRRNWDSIPNKFKPLKNRVNIIISSNFIHENNCLNFTTLEESIEYCDIMNYEEIFIIGGGKLYEYALKNNLVNKLYITEVQSNFEADVFFPKIDYNEWKQIYEQFHPIDDKHNFSFVFKQFVKY